MPYVWSVHISLRFGGGMYTYLVDVTGTAYTDEDGVTILEGDLDDGSNTSDQKIKAILTKNDI